MTVKEMFLNDQEYTPCRPLSSTAAKLPRPSPLFSNALLFMSLRYLMVRQTTYWKSKTQIRNKRVVGLDTGIDFWFMQLQRQNPWGKIRALLSTSQCLSIATKRSEANKDDNEYYVYLSSYFQNQHEINGGYLTLRMDVSIYGAPD